MYFDRNCFNVQVRDMKLTFNLNSAILKQPNSTSRKQTTFWLKLMNVNIKLRQLLIQNLITLLVINAIFDTQK